MPLRQALIMEIGGLVYFNPSEQGTITQATVNLYDWNGVLQVSSGNGGPSGTGGPYTDGGAAWLFKSTPAGAYTAEHLYAANASVQVTDVNGNQNVWIAPAGGTTGASMPDGLTAPNPEPGAQVEDNGFSWTIAPAWTPLTDATVNVSYTYSNGNVYECSTSGETGAGPVTITQAVADPPALAILGYTIGQTSELVSQLGENCRALWTYVVAGLTYRRATTFDVVMNLVFPTLTQPFQLFEYYPILENRDFLGNAKQLQVIAKAWEILCNRIRQSGKNPNRIIDPSSFEPAHAALAASMISRNYRPGSAQATDWQAWAKARAEDYNRMFDSVMANYPWYDLNEDLIPTIDEEHLGLRAVRLSR